jgi:GDP-D-mannose 3',5'-epimerase
MKTALVLGAGGFIGNHLVSRLKSEGYFVRGVDLKLPDYNKSEADEFISGKAGDLRNADNCRRLVKFDGEQGNYFNNVPEQYKRPFDEIYQLAADMGGAGFIFTGDNDADIMHNSASINLNILNAVKEFNDHRFSNTVDNADDYNNSKTNQTKIFYSSSACMYPEHNQLDPDNPNCEESSAYPANPDSEYGWEKLFSERLFLAYNRNHGIPVRVARFHNIFGPLGTWNGGREKAPAAICRKVIEAENEIEIWGDGKQTRSFLYVEECVEGIRRLVNSDFTGPVNIGSDEMVTINELVDIASKVEGKDISKKHIDGPLGVAGRNSDNNLIQEKIGWSPDYPLTKGIEKTYKWIKEQINLK